MTNSYIKDYILEDIVEYGSNAVVLNDGETWSSSDNTYVLVNQNGYWAAFNINELVDSYLKRTNVPSQT